MLIAKVVSTIIILIARFISTKDTLVTFKNIIVILIVKFVPAEVLLVSILFVIIKIN